MSSNICRTIYRASSNNGDDLRTARTGRFARYRERAVAARLVQNSDSAALSPRHAQPAERMANKVTDDQINGADLTLHRLLTHAPLIAAHALSTMPH